MIEQPIRRSRVHPTDEEVTIARGSSFTGVALSSHICRYVLSPEEPSPYVIAADE